MFLLLIGGCQSFKHYHSELIETSLISEIPTIIGNIGGNIVGVPMVIITAPMGYAIYSDTPKENSEEVRNEARSNFILAPIHLFSHALGIIFGTPFYPFALIFPRNREKDEKIEKK